MAENDAQSAGHPVMDAGHPAMDYDANEKTYRMFVQLMKYATAGVATILVLLAYLWG